MSFFKPMLAAKPEPEELDNIILQHLRTPVLLSPKLDGIRCTVQDGRLYSRSLKPIRNSAMQKLWGRRELNGLDGEIICGDATMEDCFNRTSSQVMSESGGVERAKFYVFDRFDKTAPFQDRIASVEDVVHFTSIGCVVALPHTFTKSTAELLKYEQKLLKLGHEGVMTRDPLGLYKQGRSTMREQGLVAIKRFVDAEAVVVGTYEQETNTNEATKDALGHMKRTTHKAGKLGKGTLGGFTVTMKYQGKQTEFNIGTGVGLTEASRKALWAIRDTLPGRIVKFRYQHVGTMDRPRLPIYVGFRDPIDV